MKKAYSLLRGLRPSVSIPAGFLVHVGYSVSHQQTNWLNVIVMFLICGSTMLQNDYFDREHDKLKQRYFASENRKFLLCTLIVLWFIIISLIWYQRSDIILLSVVVTLCILYSFSRHCLGLPTLLVASISSFPVLLPVLHTYCLPNIVLFIAIFFGIGGREILKDIKDIAIDKGYKKTLVTENLIGLIEVQRLASISIFLGAISITMLIKYLNTIQIILIIPADFLLILSAYNLFCGLDNNKVLRRFDIGMVFTVLSLSV